MKKLLWNVIYVTVGSLLLLSSFAFAVNGRTTYQAKIYKPDGTPLESVSVNFRFTVLDPSSSCVLYIEDYAAVNMIGSGGLTSFSLGMGSRAYPVSGPTTFANVFDNSTSSFVCQSPGVYNPVPTDNRKIVMQFNEGNGWQTLPAMAINSVPYAMYAAKSQNSEKLNGKADTSFVEYSTLASLNCQTNEAIQFNGANFACISVGSGVTSSTVSTALGYTPVNPTSFTALSTSMTTTTTTLASVSSSVFAVSSTVSSLQGTFTSFQNTVAASFAALSGSGVQNFNGSASMTQTLATGFAGTAFNISTANGVHTFNIPNAASASVTAGLLSNADYTTFTNKLSATSSAVNAALGYTPANQATVATSFTAVGASISALAATDTNFATSITTLTSTVNTNTTSITALTSTVNTHTASITGLTSTVNTNTTSVTALTTTVNTHTASIATLTSGVNTNTASITALTSTVNNHTTSLTSLASTVNSHSASLAALTSSQWTTSGSTINYGAGNVGIGITNPVYPLDVNLSMRAGNGSGTVGMGSDGNAYIELREPDNAGTPYIDFVNDNVTDYDARLILMNDDALQLNGAFLGINILPTAGLTIAQGTSTYAPLKFTSGTLLTSPQSGTMEYDGYNYYLTDGANQRRMIATGSSQGAIDNTSQINSTSNLTLNPNGIVVASSAMQVNGNLSSNGNLTTSGSLSANGNITTSGSIGIGTLSPGEKLDVNGNMRIGSGDSNYIAFRGTTGDGAGSYNHTYIGERFYGGSESSELFLFKGNDSDNTSGPDRIRLAGGNIVFDTYNTPDAPSGTFEGVATSPLISTKMIIKGNGNVGIGTAGPTVPLDIVGPNNQVTQLRITNNDNINGASYYSVNAQNGNPYTEMQRWTGIGSNYNATRSTTYATGDFVISNTSGPGGTIGSQTFVDRLFIAGTGNVGIGTTTPSSLNGWGRVLDVFAPAHSKVVATQATAGVSVTTGVYSHGLTGNGYAGYPQSYGGVGLVGTETAHDLGIMTSNTTRMSVTKTGQVGINTISPQAQLDVNGNIRSTGYTFVAPPGDPAPTISTRTVPAGQGASNEKTELILFHSNDFNNGAGNDQITLRAPALSFQTYASATVATIDDNGGYNERMYITPTGEVGVGTTNPSGKLSLNGNGAYFTKETTAGIDGVVDGVVKYGFGGDLVAGGSGNTNRWHGIDATITAGTGAANKMLFKMFQGGNNNTAGAYVMTLQGDGNVGIGTTAPSTKLEVAGGDINVPTGRVSFNSGVLTGTAGIASTDSGAIFGEHDVNSETSRLVIEVADNQNDQIVLRTNAPSGGANVDMVKVQYDQIQLAPTTGNVGIGVATPTSKLQVNGGIKQPNYGVIWVTFDGATRIVSMPTFLSDAYMSAHQDETFTWRAGGPTLKDSAGCNAGPQANYQFNNLDSTWAGTYRMTIGNVNGTNVVDLEWAGWGVNLLDGSFSVIPTNSNEGVVHATLAKYAGGWTLEHMGGQVGATPFACH